MTVADVITAALRRINVLQEGQSPSGPQSADAFETLNALMEAWQTERLTIPYVRRTVWPITSVKGTLAAPYTVGVGGDINVARPTYLQNVNYQDTSVSPTQEYPLALLTDVEWQAIGQKNLTSTYPIAAYYSPTFASGFGSLYLWQIPTSPNLQGVLYAPAQVGAFAATSDTIVLPPGYLRFIRDNLAIELAPEFLPNVPVDPALRLSAIESKAQIKRANMRNNDMITPQFGAGIYDINADVNHR